MFRDFNERNPILEALDRLLAMQPGQSVLAQSGMEQDCAKHALAQMRPEVRARFLVFSGSSAKGGDTTWSGVVITRLGNAVASSSQGEELQDRIFRAIDKTGECAFGLLKQLCKPHPSKEIELALADLLSRGEIVQRSGVHKYNKKPFVKYARAKP